MPTEELGLLERREAVEAIATSLATARHGRMSLLFVLGEPGLGKSALLQHAVGTAAGFKVGGASGEASETLLPFGVIGRALSRAGATDLARAAPELPVAERAAATWYRARDWLASRRRPVLLCLDDLHFADPDSLRLLELLALRPTGTPVAVIAGLRPWPPGPMRTVEALVSAGTARAVRLARLSDPASVALFTRVAGHAPSPELAGRLEDLCAGNPALLQQLAAGSAGPDLPVPGSTNAPARLLLSRFTGLDAISLDYARAASIFGVEFRPALTGALAGLDESASRAALAALCGGALVLSASEGSVRFAHALLRQALYDDMPPPLRAQLHAAAFRLVWQAGLPASEAASHALAADLTGSAEAVHVLEAAGLEALDHGATALAARWLRGALHLAGARPAAELVVRLADCLLAAGEAAEAAEVCRRLLATPRGPVVTAGAYRALARALVRTGSSAEAETAFERAAAAARPGHRSLASEVLLEASQVALYTSGPKRSLHFADQALSALPAGARPELAIWAHTARGMASLAQACPQGATEIADALSRLPHGQGLRGLQGAPEWGPRLQQMQAHKFLELFDEAEEDYRLAMAEAGPSATPMARAVYWVTHADTLARTGRLLDSRETLLRSLEVLPFAPSAGAWTLVGLAHVHLELAMPDQAAGYCRAIEDVVGTDGTSLPLLRFWLWRVRALLALDAGDVGSACRLMAQAEALAGLVGALEPASAVWHPVAVRAYVAAGRYDDARRVVEALEATGEALGTRYPRAVACRGRALLAEQGRDIEGARSQFCLALGWHEGLSMPLEEVETLVAYGEFLRRHRSPAEARPVLSRALQLAQACGARRLEALATGALHAAGGRRRTGAAQAGPLTPMERRAAELAASGKTNAEIGRLLMISSRTVEHHLTRVYARLGVSSRRQLAEALGARHQQAD